jgi:hypothetical protein
MSALGRFLPTEAVKQASTLGDWPFAGPLTLHLYAVAVLASRFQSISGIFGECGGALSGLYISRIILWETY